MKRPCYNLHTNERISGTTSERPFAVDAQNSQPHPWFNRNRVKRARNDLVFDRRGAASAHASNGKRKIYTLRDYSFWCHLGVVNLNLIKSPANVLAVVNYIEARAHIERPRATAVLRRRHHKNNFVLAMHSSKHLLLKSIWHFNVQYSASISTDKPHKGKEKIWTKHVTR